MAEPLQIVGTSKSDDLLITAPTSIDGLGGVDTVRFDFSSYGGRIHLDLEGLWSGGTGSLNGKVIKNVELLGSGLGQTDTENLFLFGSDFADFIRIGSDFVQGPSVIFGLGGNDRISGGNYDGGNGLPLNYLNGGSGDDRVTGGNFGDTIIGEDGDDWLDGEGGNDLILGDAGKDNLSGGGGDDSLLGGAGADNLDGGGGNDLIDGGSGADRMTGGSGADQFRFSNLQDIAGGDLITDFSAIEGDKIDLSSLVGSEVVGLSFIGGNLFSGAAGEVRVAESGGTWLVSGDIDGDGVADFSFSVRSAAALTQSDFQMSVEPLHQSVVQPDFLV